jgi:PKD repeat protein
MSTYTLTRNVCLLVAISSSLVLPTEALPPEVVPPPSATATVQFVANQSQWTSSVLFAAEVPGGRLYLEKNRLVQALYDAKTVDELHHHAPDDTDHQIDAHAYAVSFVGANPEVVASGEHRTSSTTNYFLGADASRWARNVASYAEVRYQQLYAGTDLRFYTKQGALEYDFELAAGADVSRLQMQYEGASCVRVVAGALHITTSVGTVVEQQPYAYQVMDGHRQKVSCQYVLGAHNTVSFRLPQGYQPQLPLIIDPVLVYATYTGSTASNYGYTAAYDSLGNLYSGGIVFDIGYPTTLGAYSVSYSGNVDMGIIKYNPNAATGPASRVYATYVGGAAGDHPHSLVVDHAGNLIILGSSASNNYPTTAGSFRTSYQGGTCDIVVSKLSPGGNALLASTYLGGNAADGRVTGALLKNYGDTYRGDVTIDRQNNVYLASITQSTNFPVLLGFQQASGGGPSDAVVAKLNPALTGLVWSSYLGGTGTDAGYSIQLDSISNVFVSGGTSSSDLPGAAGGYRAAFQGGSADGFIARISPAGSQLVQSTYLGTSGYDQAYFVQLNQHGEVYAYGQTDGAYPVTPGLYVNPNSRQFIHKLNARLSNSIFSTVIGNGASGAINISPTAFLVDHCGQLLLSGFGGNIANMPLTPDAIPLPAGVRPSTSGTFGLFYIMQLSANAQELVYGTYFGNGDCHVDGGTSRFDKKGIIYQAMCVGTSATMTTTPNAWSRTNNGGYNNGAFKIDVLQLQASFTPSITPNGSRTTSGCAPLTVYFKRPSVRGSGTQWIFGNGQTSAQTNDVSTTYTTPGRYLVQLRVYDANHCLQTVSATDTIDVYAVPQPAFADRHLTICPGSAATVTVTNPTPGLTCTWAPADGLSATTGFSVVARPVVTTRYIVQATSAAGCMGQDTVWVTVRNQPLVVAAAGRQELCPGASATLTVPSFGVGATYSWSPAAGLNTTSGDTVVATPTATTLYTVLVTNADGCSGTDTVRVVVRPALTTSVGPDQNICPGSSTVLRVPSLGSGARYHWTPATGLNATNEPEVQASPTVTTRYTVRVTNAEGCSAQDSVLVIVRPPLSISAGPDQVICPGASATLSLPSAGTGISYAWSPATGLNTTSGSTVIASPSVATRYTVVATTAEGCSTQDTVLVSVRPAVSVSAGPRRFVCPGSSAPLSVAGIGPGASYSWSPATGLNTTTGSSVIATPTATTLYTVRVTNAEGCRGQDTVRVVVRPALSISAGPDQAICPGTATALSVPSLGAGAIYAWVPAAGLNTTSANSVTASPTTTTRYTVVVTNAEGCTAQSSVLVSVRPAVSVAAGPRQEICAGSSAPLSVAGIGPGASYSWSPATGLNTTTGSSVIATPTATTLYTVRVTNAEGCRGQDTVRVVVRPALSISAGPDQAICPGGATTLTVPDFGAGARYLWSPATGLNTTEGATVIASPTAATRYTVMVTTSQGCTGQASVLVALRPPLNISAGPDQTICPGFAATLSVPAQGAGATYAWSPATGLNTTSGPVVRASPTVATRYTVLVTNAEGCTALASVLVGINPAPEVAASARALNLVERLVSFSADVNAAQVSSYEWDFGDGSPADFTPNPTHAYAASGSFKARLSVSYTGGCQAEVAVPVEVQQFELPNVITPNHDGLNDTFRPFVSLEPVDIRIFSRAGRLVFQQSGYTDGWGDADTAPGIYYYQLANQRGETWKGWVEVIR